MAKLFGEIYLKLMPNKNTAYSPVGIYAVFFICDTNAGFLKRKNAPAVILWLDLRNLVSSTLIWLLNLLVRSFVRTAWERVAKTIKGV